MANIIETMEELNTKHDLVMYHIEKFKKDIEELKYAVTEMNGLTAGLELDTEGEILEEICIVCAEDFRKKLEDSCSKVRQELEGKEEE